MVGSFARSHPSGGHGDIPPSGGREPLRGTHSRGSRPPLACREVPAPIVAAGGAAGNVRGTVGGQGTASPSAFVGRPQLLWEVWVKIPFRAASPVDGQPRVTENP